MNPIIRNSLTTATAAGLPLLIGFALIPFLLQRIGPERFGLITITWGSDRLFFVRRSRRGPRAHASALGACLGRTIIGGVADTVSTAMSLVLKLSIAGGGSVRSAELAVDAICAHGAARNA